MGKMNLDKNTAPVEGAQKKKKTDKASSKKPSKHRGQSAVEQNRVRRIGQHLKSMIKKFTKKSAQLEELKKVKPSTKAKGPTVPQSYIDGLKELAKLSIGGTKKLQPLFDALAPRMVDDEGNFVAR